MKIELLRNEDHRHWDDFVLNHPRGELYHLSGWKTVIEKAYRHKTYYLTAIKELSDNQGEVQNKNNDNTPICGILPLVHIKSMLFGSSLVSIPFFDLGGIIADDDETEKALIEEAIKLGQKLKADTIELRHQTPLNWLDPSKQTSSSMPFAPHSMHCVTKSHKVRMMLELPESSEVLMKSFKSKLRSQIKKPVKEGLEIISGGIELLDKFYDVFTVNMRDLGSPVHSKKLLKSVMEVFSDRARIFIVEKDKIPLACSMVIGFKKIAENPWASALREYSRLSPNMLLYWGMLEYACDNRFDFFDFGRSSPDEGTYKFKAQWGASPVTLNWQLITSEKDSINNNLSDKSGFSKAISIWQKLPVSLTKIIGPALRKNISL